MLKQVKQFVDKYFKVKKPHFERTIYWLKQLKPNADEAMQIAAYAHDIERVVGRPTIAFYRTHELNDPVYLKKHSNGGAKMISEFLKEHNYSKEDTKRVAEMVKLHEVGGTTEADLIKDADSLSYFEKNAPRHIEKFGKPLGKEKLRRKYNFMFNRITSSKAKKIAKPMYDKAMKLLEAL